MSKAIGGDELSLSRESELARARLRSLIDTNPSMAIVEARQLSNHPNMRLLRAATLCDAGSLVRDISAVQEATKLFSELRAVLPENATLAYNLANALTSEASFNETERPDWYLATASLRRRARSMFGEAAKAQRDGDRFGASQAMTNLGHAFDSAHRWIEAFECYQRAIGIFPRNGVASGSAARVLHRIAQVDLLGDRAHLTDVALRLAHHSKSNCDVVAEMAGSRAVSAFEQLPSTAGPLHIALTRKRATAYERFVAKHRLVLSPVFEGLGRSPRRWDDAHIAGITESLGADACTPPLFAMFNVMKADYLVTRELLFQGIQEGSNPRDTGLYFDTLDYATYGTTPSRLVLAQRAALDLLDKIAVALNDHFAIGQKTRDANFHQLWRENPGSSTWRPVLAAAIMKGNPALIALSEIAADLTDGAQVASDVGVPGVLYETRRIRHAGTHRFIVLHDFGIGNFRSSPAVEHHELDAFQDAVVNTVRLARAALLHFLEVIAYSERARPISDGLIGTLDVHPHHWVRGEN